MDRIAALQLFVRLAERGSFSAAAKDLGVKQSTASKWVAELESELGASLARRTTRSVSLTEEGRRLVARAREVLAAFETLRTEFEEKKAEPAGRLRVSVPVVFGRLFVVPALIGFLKRHALVEVELTFNDRYVNVIDEGFDLAVRVGVPVDTSARGHKRAESRRVLVASPGYIKARGQPTAPRDLKRHECLVHGDASSPAIWRFASGDGDGIPVAVRGRAAANNSEAVLALARSGLGIALLADWLVRGELKKGGLVELLPAFRAPPAPIYALSPPGRFLSPAVRALIEHLGNVLPASLRR